MPKIYLFIISLLVASTAFSQRTIVGTVTDEDGEALDGATVIVQGTDLSTTIQSNGKFLLDIPQHSVSLLFSALGYIPQEIQSEGKSAFYVQLVRVREAAIQKIEVAYAKQQKKEMAGAVSAIQGSDLTTNPSLNLSGSLAGLLPGLTVVSPGGEPGYDGAMLFVRGINPLGGTSALVVVDGIPRRYGGLDRINAADIESVSVLKDAAMTMYGTANGVILVRTRRGQIGKPYLTYSFNQGFSKPTFIPKMANAAQYASMLNDLSIYSTLPTSEWVAADQAYRATGVYTRPNGTVRQAPYSPSDLLKYREGSDPWTHPTTDWFGATIKPYSPQARHTLQLTGGTARFQYMASLGYLSQDAYYRQSATGYRQYDLRINLDTEINPYIRLSLGMLGRKEAREYSPQSATTIFRMLMRGKPQEPAYWPTGLPGPDLENGYNPVVIVTPQAGYDHDARNFVQTNGTLGITIPGVKGLEINATIAVDYYNQNAKRWETPWTLYFRGNGFEPDGITPQLLPIRRGPEDTRLTVGTVDQLNLTPRVMVSYEKKVGAHAFSWQVGRERYKVRRAFFNASRRYFISNALDQLFAGSDAGKDNGGNEIKASDVVYLGRTTYAYKEKYFAELQAHVAESRVLPETGGTNLLYGAMFGWIVSEERFWKHAKLPLTFLKIRASAAKLGSGQAMALLPYNSRQTDYVIGTASSSPVPFYVVKPMVNVGVEGRLFEDKLTVEFDVFSNPKTQLYSLVPHPPREPEEKVTRITNQGWEGSLVYRNKLEKLTYRIGINGGYANNKVLSDPDLIGSGTEQSRLGKPLHAFLVYQYDGVFRDQAEIDANTLDYSLVVSNLRPGDMKYKDSNGDGKITPNDRVRKNFTNLPLFQGGITLYARYKGFDLNLLVQGAAGARQFIGTGESGTLGNYLLYSYQNRWTIDAPSEVHPRIANRGDQYYSSGNDYWLRSTDYIRLKTLEAGYSFQNSLLTKVGMSSFRLYVSGVNLATLDKLKVFDPESNNPLGYYYPQSTLVTFGCSASF